MSTTEQRLAANRANAANSTGPITAHGKAASSRNAIRHGLLSSKLLLDGDDPDEFHDVLSRLWRALAPVGAIEELLVERIAVSIWRQRRLVQSETAALTLERMPRRISGNVSSELGRGYGSELKADELVPFDADQAEWCRAVVAEIDALEAIELSGLEGRAPLVHGQLVANAAEDEETPEVHAANHKGGLTGYVAELLLWCRDQLRQAEARPRILALAEDVRAKRLLLPADALELLARYQTTLDNQLYKALRALRETQEWRLKTLEPSSVPNPEDAEDLAAAA